MILVLLKIHVIPYLGFSTSLSYLSNFSGKKFLRSRSYLESNPRYLLLEKISFLLIQNTPPHTYVPQNLLSPKPRPPNHLLHYIPEQPFLPPKDEEKKKTTSPDNNRGKRIATSKQKKYRRDQTEFRGPRRYFRVR